MAQFKDSKDRAWSVEWDGIVLDQVRTETGVDLADLSGGGLALLQQDHPKLVKVLAVLCRDDIRTEKITEREFSKRLKQDVLTSAYAAVIEAAADFFPQSEWSEIQQRLSEQGELRKAWLKMKPYLAKLNDAEMEWARPAVLTGFSEMMGGLSGDALQGVLASVSGQAAIPSSPASDSPGKSESAHAA